MAIPLPDSLPPILLTLAIALCGYWITMGIFSPKWNPKGKHCYVTGGSSGLGLEVAINLTRKGANVSIVARNKEILATALKTLESHRVSPDQHLASYSFPLNTGEGSAAALHAACEPFDGRVPDAAFLCAGSSQPGWFVDMDEAALKKGMEQGYWVQAFSALEIVKSTARQEFKGGKIVFVGSTLSYMGFAGWSSYAPAKHALRGLADTLRNELILYGTDVYILGAPTMKSPGYANEMKTKPRIVSEIEGDDGHPMDKVAEKLVSAVANNQNHIAYDLVTDLFRVSTRGSAPHHNNFLLEASLGMIAWVGIPIWRWDTDGKLRGHRGEHRQYLKDKGIIA
ncbi:3-dehydrosphinganine reductase [Tulasnella sp. JGI-2019a]|nr:3-dehydrosphinganine reductase [Tulasnella sp. JGI-2019a]KAG9016906.1 3-dehydrosphinganine reductase [Tulasnella sp. JGI-2019a]KAG9040198.1 3-dehydrosphinganine reductase [Tulasnella sp. JGI-2019a]